MTGGVVPGIGGLVTAAVFVATGSVLVALCRHPQLTARWLRYRWHLGRNTARRLASVVLSVMVGLIAVVIIAAVTLLGTELKTLFTTIQTELAKAGK